MSIGSGEPRSLGAERGSWLRFGEEAKAEGAWAGRRLLFVGERPAFELSFWCGTCPFLFRRLEGATETGSINDMEHRLSRGLSGLEGDVIERFAAILPRDEYLPMLLRVEPRLVKPALSGDYFSQEQLTTWGTGGVLEYPNTPYYRTFQTPVDEENHLFEFVVPMVPPSWNGRDRVDAFRTMLATSGKPTAVAVSILDVCQPAVADGTDYFAHWGLTHFLLDGHHKMEAAATTGRPLQLLSLLAVGAGLAAPDRVARVPQLRSQRLSGRR